MSAVPVVVIGLDSCDPTLAAELAAAGGCRRSPRCSRRRHGGDPQPLRLLRRRDLAHASTTANSAERSRLPLLERGRPGTYERRLTQARASSGAPFWRAIADAGHRVAVDRRPPPLARATSRRRDRGLRVGLSRPPLRPAQLAAGARRELVARHGPASGARDRRVTPSASSRPTTTFAREGELRSTEEDAPSWLAALLDGVEAKRADLARAARARAPGTCSSCVFGESHASGHQFWHHHDPGHPRHDPASRPSSAIRSPQLYAHARRARSPTHVERRGPETTVVVLLSHGMSAHYDGTHMLHEVLRRIDDATTATASRGPRQARRRPAARYLRLPAAARRGARRPSRRSCAPTRAAASCPSAGAFGEERPGLASAASSRPTTRSTAASGSTSPAASRTARSQPGAEFDARPRAARRGPARAGQRRHRRAGDRRA